MTYRAAKRKLMIEKAGMFPFVLLGRICAYFFRLNTKHRVFLLFPELVIMGFFRENDQWFMGTQAGRKINIDLW